MKPTASSIVRMASNSPFGSTMYGRDTLSGYQKSTEQGAGQRRGGKEVLGLLLVIARNRGVWLVGRHVVDQVAVGDRAGAIAEERVDEGLLVDRVGDRLADLEVVERLVGLVEGELADGQRRSG